jgi:hypothetical protein
MQTTKSNATHPPTNPPTNNSDKADKAQAGSEAYPVSLLASLGLADSPAPGLPPSPPLGAHFAPPTPQVEGERGWPFAAAAGAAGSPGDGAGGSSSGSYGASGSGTGSGGGSSPDHGGRTAPRGGWAWQ